MLFPCAVPKPPRVPRGFLVAHSFISSFADDTRIGNGIQTIEDASQLQQDLDKVYQWATRNNMTFNGTKFDLIRYGQNTQLKKRRGPMTDP